MRQADSTQFEEYITLRHEILQLWSHCRFVLYWTAVFIIVGLGWFFRQGWNPDRDLEAGMFSLFLLLLLAISCYVYCNNVWHIYYIGGYIAVFCESRDSERHLQWHRLNRRGGVKGLVLQRLPKDAVVVSFL
jgi:hypothetical protein